MEKSIETIWKQGFLKSDTLIAPKVNNLYERKSIHTIDKFKRMGKNNLYGITIGALVVFAVATAWGVPLIGGLFAASLLALVVIGKRRATALEKINSGLSSYEYLKAFDLWLKESIHVYSKAYRFFYPLITLVLMAFILLAKDGRILEKIMSNPDTLMVNGWPIVWIGFGVIFFLLSAFFSQKLYLFDLDMIYGRIFKKIEELIADMEELRAA